MLLHQAILCLVISYAAVSHRLRLLSHLRVLVSILTMRECVDQTLKQLLA